MPDPAVISPEPPLAAEKLQAKTDLLLHLADTTLVLAQRNAAWCGHGPILEQDIALTNIALDLLGQSRNFYQYAAELIGNTDEDALAYLRKEREFKNLLLVEQPNGDWGQTILRQYLFSQYQQLLFKLIEKLPDEQLASIATKAMKEISYHVRWSAEWVIRLGDGTAESNERMKTAVQELWRYTGELFRPAEYETSMTLDVASLQESWQEKVAAVFAEATLTIPANTFMQEGGKQGLHTEHLGYLLSDLQFMQRAYPGAKW